MFRQLLSEVVERVDGGLAGLVMGPDGITVATYHRPDRGADIEEVGMEFSVVVGQIRRAVEMLGGGDAREIVVESETMVTVIRLLDDGYFVVLTIDPYANLGKARYVLRVNEPRLRSELA